MSFPKHHTHLELASCMYHFHFGAMPLTIATSNNFYPVPLIFLSNGEKQFPFILNHPTLQPSTPTTRVIISLYIHLFIYSLQGAFKYKFPTEVHMVLSPGLGNKSPIAYYAATEQETKLGCVFLDQ